MARLSPRGSDADPRPAGSESRRGPTSNSARGAPRRGPNPGLGFLSEPSGALPMTQDLKTPHPKSNGPTPSAKRFVGQVMEFTLREGWRTPEDFLRFFPAEAIMEALKGAPELRVSILSLATGMHEQILERKSLRYAAEDLRLALEQGSFSSLQLLDAFPAVERVRFLDTQRLWDFVVEDQFWTLDVDASPELRRSAASRLSFTLSSAFREKLITLRDVLDGLTYDAVADSLSPDELRRVVRFALI